MIFIWKVLKGTSDFLQGNGLDLTDTLSTDAERITDFLERERLTTSGVFQHLMQGKPDGHWHASFG